MRLHSGHIILIPSWPVFALIPSCCMLSGEAANTDFIVFGLTLSWLKSTIYSTWGKHAINYITDAVSCGQKSLERPPSCHTRFQFHWDSEILQCNLSELNLHGTRIPFCSGFSLDTFHCIQYFPSREGHPLSDQISNTHALR
jgi:hypothetical protein